MLKRWLRRRWLLLLGAALFAWYVSAVPDPFYLQPGPVRAFRRNRERIEAYVASIEAGRVPMREHNRGYYVLDVLLAHDATYVRKEGDCVVVTFAFMPTDPVPVLVYSPKWLAGLPGAYWPGGRPAGKPSTWKVYDFTPTDDNWFYLRWDF
jgi:hypothetical protein